MKHLNDPLPLPRQFNPTIPEPFEQILLKALAKRPADRYQTAGHMAAAIQQALDLTGIQLPPHVSPARSFTTFEAPSEPVAVISGAARTRIADTGFSKDDTDPALQRQLSTQPDPAARAVATAVQPLHLVQQILLTTLGLVVMVNLVAVTIVVLTRNGEIFIRGWPMELFLVSWGLTRLGRLTRIRWLLIPAGLLLGNGLIFAYYAVSRNWGRADLLWLLEVWLAVGMVGFIFWLVRQGGRFEPKVARVSRLFELTATVCWVIILVLAAVGPA
jgi:hypothetical protein